MVLVFGLAIPVVALVALFGVANVYLIRQTSPPAPASTAMTIDVIGHQWWWEVRYPGTDAVTANEIHIPVDTRVNVVATTADVIHSFWVPALNRKIDMIPGRRNRILFYASSPGVYRGQCSQFCGLQHAHMALNVFAQRPPRYRAWLANMASAARVPMTAAARAGERLFMGSECASCRTDRGHPGAGRRRPRPDARRDPHDPRCGDDPQHAELAGGVDPQPAGDQTRRPDARSGLSASQVSTLVAYVETLK